MTKQDKDLLLRDLCARLPYGVRGKVEADTVVPHQYDMDGFPIETTFDVDVELQQINISNDEIFVNANTGNEDLDNYICESQTDGKPWIVDEFTPYLRPISSMTEEEIDKLFDILKIDKASNDNDWIKINDALGIKFFFPTGKWIEDVALAYDYLNSIHIDYRGLIEKGLAIAVTAENNPYK